MPIGNIHILAKMPKCNWQSRLVLLYARLMYGFEMLEGEFREVQTLISKPDLLGELKLHRASDNVSMELLPLISTYDESGFHYTDGEFGQFMQTEGEIGLGATSFEALLSSEN
jgi:hypothetical protein